jgi:hypothetical protein
LGGRYLILYQNPGCEKEKTTEFGEISEKFLPQCAASAQRPAFQPQRGAQRINVGCNPMLAHSLRSFMKLSLFTY